MQEKGSGRGGQSLTWLPWSALPSKGVVPLGLVGSAVHKQLTPHQALPALCHCLLHGGRLLEVQMSEPPQPAIVAVRCAMFAASASKYAVPVLQCYPMTLLLQ